MDKISMNRNVPSVAYSFTGCNGTYAILDNNQKMDSQKLNQSLIITPDIARAIALSWGFTILLSNNSLCHPLLFPIQFTDEMNASDSSMP